MCCWVKEQLDQGTAGESEKQHGGVGVDGFVEFDGFVELFCAACVSGAVWLDLLACLLGWGWSMSLWGGVGCGVVGLQNGDCAGRHGGAPARPYVGGIAHTRRRSCLSLFPFYSAWRVLSSLMVLTQPRHGKGDGDEDRKSIFFWASLQGVIGYKSSWAKSAGE